MKTIFRSSTPVEYENSTNKMVFCSFTHIPHVNLGGGLGEQRWEPFMIIWNRMHIFDMLPWTPCENSISGLEIIMFNEISVMSLKYCLLNILWFFFFVWLRNNYVYFTIIEQYYKNYKSGIIFGLIGRIRKIWEENEKYCIESSISERRNEKIFERIELRLKHFNELRLMIRSTFFLIERIHFASSFVELKSQNLYTKKLSRDWAETSGR